MKPNLYNVCLLILLCLFASILVSCDNFTQKERGPQRQLAIFFDPSHSINIEKYPIKVYLNNSLIVDTLMVNTHVNSSLLFYCGRLDTTRQNKLTVQVFNKSKAFDLNSYHVRCIDIFSYYDNFKALRDEYWKAEQNGHAPNSSFKAFLDSIKSKGERAKYDSLKISVQTDKCWCDSTADHDENKTTVPGIIKSYTIQ